MGSTYGRYGLAGLGAVVYVLLLAPNIGAVPLDAFIPFGQSAGDSVLPPNDDNSSIGISLSQPFLFLGSSESLLFVNNNGNITFDGPLATFTPFPFPNTHRLIAAYFADVDTRSSPNVTGDGLDDMYFSARTDPADLEAISTIIHQAFNRQFLATSAFVATWDHVGYYNRHTDLRNTFQLVLATDGVKSFVIFHYLDNETFWETGDASEGIGGFGGTQASAGFDAGNTRDFLTVPGSRMAGIARILQGGSNLGVPGQWVFQVDTSILQPNILIGDVDADGDRDELDARQILEVLVGLAPAAAIHFASAGDINADGDIDNRDSIVLLAVVSERIHPPPDQSRITATDNRNGTATVTGTTGSVPSSSTVNLVNTASSATVSGLADAAGRFVVTLTAVAGDRILIDVDGSPAHAAVIVEGN